MSKCAECGKIIYEPPCYLHGEEYHLNCLVVKLRSYRRKKLNWISGLFRLLASWFRKEQ